MSSLPDQTVSIDVLPPKQQRTPRPAPAENSQSSANASAPWQSYIPLKDGQDVSMVPGCTLEAILGHGGMGTIYLARQDALDRQVAVKVLRERYASNHDFIDRLRREAKIMGAMSHPNLVGCHDIIISRAGVSLLMEYIPGHLNGRNLVDLLGPMPEVYAVKVLSAVAKGLAYANAKGFTHRDVKPENILFSFSHDRAPRNYDELFHAPDARIALCDFGIADAKAEALKADNPEGKIFGSPHYMAPEQAVMPDKIDCRTDIYSLGSSLFFLLTGKAPFTGANFEEIIEKKVESDLPQPKPPTGRVTMEMSHLISKMGALAMERRYQDYNELLKDIESLELLHADRAQSFKAFIYGHQRSLWIAFFILATVMLLALAATLLYTKWTQDFEGRMISQTINFASWSGDRTYWLQRINSAGLPVLHGNSKSAPLTLTEPVMPGGYIRVNLQFQGTGNVKLHLFSNRQVPEVIGAVICHREYDQNRVELFSQDFNQSDAVLRSMPAPVSIPDAYNEDLDLRIQIREGYFTVWNRRQLIGVGHFDYADTLTGVLFQISAVNCEGVVVNKVLTVEEKYANRIYSEQ